MVRSNRINAALLLCKQRLLQWDTENYYIFERELEIKIDRTAGIIANINPLLTDYSRSSHDINLWMRERLELNVWNIGKSIAILDRETTRVISIRFPLPPMILKIPEYWNSQLKDKLIDFSFYIEIIRTSSVIDDCSNSQNVPLSYVHCNAVSKI